MFLYPHSTPPSMGDGGHGPLALPFTANLASLASRKRSSAQNSSSAQMGTANLGWRIQETHDSGDIYVYNAWTYVYIYIIYIIYTYNLYIYI